MSDPRTGPREWHFYVDDMITFARKVQTYTADLDQARFVADARTYDAALRNLELIGEAATPHPRRNPRRPSRRSLAIDHRHAQPSDSCLPRNRQRYALEHHSG